VRDVALDAGFVQFTWPIYKSGLRIMISGRLVAGSTWAFAAAFHWSLWLACGGTAVLVSCWVPPVAVVDPFHSHKAIPQRSGVYPAHATTAAARPTYRLTTPTHWPVHCPLAGRHADCRHRALVLGCQGEPERLWRLALGCIGQDGVCSDLRGGPPGVCVTPCPLVSVCGVASGRRSMWQAYNG
jgi:hypothetical protein